MRNPVMGARVGDHHGPRAIRPAHARVRMPDHPPRRAGTAHGSGWAAFGRCGHRRGCHAPPRLARKAAARSLRVKLGKQRVRQVLQGRLPARPRPWALHPGCGARRGVVPRVRGRRGSGVCVDRWFVSVLRSHGRALPRGGVLHAADVRRRLHLRGARPGLRAACDQLRPSVWDKPCLCRYPRDRLAVPRLRWFRWRERRIRGRQRWG